VPTRVQQAGLRLEDVPRPSLGQILRRDRLDAKMRRALGRSSDSAGRRGRETVDAALGAGPG